ncbi:ras family small GTPase [Naegleria gruberi]|uniref:Ras family small GTPase n=1 Tax=Naegleria gruberi TaxID=5762 RepID=D2VD28_NAEGR|nr:ras family small GTPase [Naegleria gruberi]EFC45163.1 ras family small GTPase [Naegleria gruberi]|eukprot:XP_002677907.1 ras family small GTPase [Naegleria gruberi strain NEG-M]
MSGADFVLSATTTNNNNGDDTIHQKIQLFTQAIGEVDQEGKSTTNASSARRWSFSSDSSSSSSHSSNSSSGADDTADDEDEEITMVWNNATDSNVDNNIETSVTTPLNNKIVIITNEEDIGEEENTLSDSSDIISNTYNSIEQKEEDKPVVPSYEKFSLKEQLKLKLPSSILHLTSPNNTTSNNNSSTQFTTTTLTDNSSKSSSPQTPTEKPTTNGDESLQIMELNIESPNEELDDTSRRFTFNSTDIIKAVFEGKHDEEVGKLLQTDVSDYLTQLVKRKNQITNPVVMPSPSPIKRMNSTFLTPSTPLGMTKSGSSSDISSPCSSPNLDKLNTIIEKKKLSRSNTTVHNYTLSPELKQRRKITAIGSGMIPNDFNMVQSPLSDYGIDFSQSDSKITASKRSMSIGPNLQSYYSSSTNAMKSDPNSVSTDDIYRVTILGSVGVGKSSLINKFIKGTFSNEYNSTVFEDIYHKPLMFLKYQEIKLLEILDTSALHIKHYKNKANQEDESPSMEIPSSFLSDYIINCDAYILVYSVDDIQSYKYCKDIYKSIVGQKKMAGLKRTRSNLRASGNSLIATPRTVARSDVPLVLVGNKSDVGIEEKFIDSKVVWEDVHTELAFGSNCSFVETSAKKEDVDCIFQALVNRICLREEPKTSSKIQISSSLPTKKTGQHDSNKKCVIL